MGKRIKKKVIDIPREIMEEILYKLPVKTLLRFKCVSKPWRSLISSKYFIKHHLKKSSTDDDNTADSTHHNNLIFSFEYRQTNLMGLGSCSLLCNEPVVKPNIDICPTEIPYSFFEIVESCNGSSFEIVGSCNGLVLIKVNQGIGTKLLLWNPSTRQVCRNIPLSYDVTQLSQLSRRTLLRDFLYGFGYDESKDEYKVVCIKVFPLDKPYETQMYSSKTGSWKKIGNFDKGTFRSFHSAKFVNGRFHWLSRDRLGHDQLGWGGTYNIVSLDLLQEEYETVAGPNCMSYYNHDCRYLKLEDLGGYLSLVGVTYGPIMSSDVSVSVWAMMEYGKRESWTKIWTRADFVVDPIERRMLMPLWLKKNGDVALAFGSDIVVYNGKNEVRKYRVDLPDARINFILYLESLVSPFVHR